MNSVEFQTVKKNIGLFRSNSLQYTEYDEISDFKIIHHSDKGLLIQGMNIEKQMNEIHWAADDATFIVESLPGLAKPFIIPFVPDSWVSRLISKGFDIFAIWNDFFKEPVNSEDCIPYSDLLAKEDAKKLSELTMTCRGQSRGFTGQSETFCRNWLSPDDGTENWPHDKAVIGHFSENILSGAVFVATYGENKTLWIREIVVSPEHQGKGIGRRLMKQALCYGTEKTVKKAFLAADECNKNAIHLYKSLGFHCNPTDHQIDMIYSDII